MTPHPAPAPIQVRPARRDDAAEIALLAGQLGYPSSAGDVERRMKEILPDDEHAVYVAETTKGKIAGWVHVYGTITVEADRRAEIGGLVVDEERRGAGIGRMLMQQAEQWAREKGYGVVNLRSNVIRKEAHAFYERLGYTSPKSQRAFRKTL